ncbi:hypothetical protein [Acinetobacter puyangensis]|uniref:hypothetical protein n=1 Tax=Acinetobacter puyangensis TaxID=1096779 RepID=UPI003A4D8783
MSTLLVSKIFNHFDFYQKNYQTILLNPTQYYIAVENAYLQLPFSVKIPLFLGDLLQLWFSQQWVYHTIDAYLFNPQDIPFKINTDRNIYYLYQIDCSGLSRNSAKVYTAQNQQENITLHLHQILQYLSTYKLLTRPQPAHFNDIKQAV